MKRFLRSQLEKRFPRITYTIRAVRNRRYFRRRFATFHASVCGHLYPDGGPTVLQGPFRGMHYLNETVWGSITPKWLGSYEAELHPVMQQIAARSYTSIIDVGCAEGYYAVGLALRVPSARIFAFDVDFLSRRQLHRLAATNGIEERIAVRSYCEHSDIEALATANTLLVCDIEGSERELLDPVRAPSLRQADILVEVHESSDVSRETECSLVARFLKTHTIQRIVARSRDDSLHSLSSNLLRSMPESLLLEALAEHRTTGIVWLWMQSLHRQEAA